MEKLGKAVGFGATCRNIAQCRDRTSDTLNQFIPPEGIEVNVAGVRFLMKREGLSANDPADCDEMSSELLLASRQDTRVPTASTMRALEEEEDCEEVVFEEDARKVTADSLVVVREAKSPEKRGAKGRRRRDQWLGRPFRKLRLRQQAAVNLAITTKRQSVVRGEDEGDVCVAFSQQEEERDTALPTGTTLDRRRFMCAETRSAEICRQHVKRHQSEPAVERRAEYFETFVAGDAAPPQTRHEFEATPRNIIFKETTEFIDVHNDRVRVKRVFKAGEVVAVIDPALVCIGSTLERVGMALTDRVDPFMASENPLFPSWSDSRRSYSARFSVDVTEPDEKRIALAFFPFAGYLPNGRALKDNIALAVRNRQLLLIAKQRINDGSVLTATRLNAGNPTYWLNSQTETAPRRADPDSRLYATPSGMTRLSSHPPESQVMIEHQLKQSRHHLGGWESSGGCRGLEEGNVSCELCWVGEEHDEIGQHKGTTPAQLPIVKQPLPPQASTDTSDHFTDIAAAALKAQVLLLATQNGFPDGSCITPNGYKDFPPATLHAVEKVTSNIAFFLPPTSSGIPSTPLEPNQQSTNVGVASNVLDEPALTRRSDGEESEGAVETIEGGAALTKVSGKTEEVASAGDAMPCETGQVDLVTTSYACESEPASRTLTTDGDMHANDAQVSLGSSEGAEPRKGLTPMSCAGGTSKAILDAHANSPQRALGTAAKEAMANSSTLKQPENKPTDEDRAPAQSVFSSDRSPGNLMESSDQSCEIADPNVADGSEPLSESRSETLSAVDREETAEADTNMLVSCTGETCNTPKKEETLPDMLAGIRTESEVIAPKASGSTGSPYDAVEACAEASGGASPLTESYKPWAILGRIYSPNIWKEFSEVTEDIALLHHLFQAEVYLRLACMGKAGIYVAKQLEETAKQISSRAQKQTSADAGQMALKLAELLLLQAEDLRKKANSDENSSTQTCVSEANLASNSSQSTSLPGKSNSV